MAAGGLFVIIWVALGCGLMVILFTDKENFEPHLWIPRSNRKFIEIVSYILNLFKRTLILCYLFLEVINLFVKSLVVS